MLGGVTVGQWETVSIDSKMEVGQDTVNGAFARIGGRTTIGAECVEAGTITCAGVEKYQTEIRGRLARRCCRQCEAGRR